jgi:putative lipase involved disintegration of autophagic bodies
VNFVSFGDTPSFEIDPSTFISYSNVLSYAKMASYMYKKADDKDTVHAYVFSDNKTAIVAFKGTSLTSKTSNNDKINDNLFFSCCFYKENTHFRDICENDKDKIICKSECFTKSLTMDNNYLQIAKELVETTNVLNEYENVYFTGHSLGGTLASYMGLIYNRYTATFQSPGEKHYFTNSGIQIDKNALDKVYHFGHNADVIFTGKCNGRLSWCWMAGYNIETKCHLGKVCTYDAIKNLGIRESILTHRIDYVVDNIIPFWNGSLPDCVDDELCEDCKEWDHD